MGGALLCLSLLKKNHTMKKTLIVLGVILILFSIVSIKPYIFDYSRLPDYGQGFIVGRALIILIGIVLIVLGRRQTAK